MTTLERIDRLSARLAAVLDEMTHGTRGAPAPSLGFIQAETAEICRTLSGLPLAERKLLLGRIEALAAQLAGIGAQVELRLGDLNSGLTAAGPRPAGGTG